MKKNITIILVSLIAFIFSTGCSDMMDVHSEYIRDGETIYSVKVDSAEIYPGNQRIKIKGYLQNAFKVEQIVVKWENEDKTVNTESFAYDFDQSPGMFTVEFQAEEGVHLFEITTRDDQGNSSVPMQVSAKIYGDEYRSNLKNRSLENLSPDIAGGIKMVFGPTMDDLIVMKINYQATDGKTTSIIVPENHAKVIIDDIDLNTPLTYSSGYLPGEMVIDTFYSSTETVSLEHLTGLEYEFAKENWEIINFSSHQVGWASNCIDGNIDSFWQSAYSDPGLAPLPHHVTIDMKYVVTVTEIDLYRRTGVNHTKTVKLEGSMDGNEWEEVGVLNYTEDAALQNEILEVPEKKMRYIKITITESYLPEGFGSIGEIFVKGVNL